MVSEWCPRRYHLDIILLGNLWMNEELRQAADAAKDPAAYHWLTYLWVMLISGWGGLVRFLNSLHKRRETIRSALLTLSAGLVTSTFVGVLTFWLCELANFQPLSTAICVAITGHMGAEALRLMQSGVISRAKAAWQATTNPPNVDSEVER